MNLYCKVCGSAFGVVEDYSCPYFVMGLSNIISEKYKCQDCGATFTHNKEANRWDYDKNINLIAILPREIK